jgi:hypothetical protein
LSYFSTNHRLSAGCFITRTKPYIPLSFSSAANILSALHRRPVTPLLASARQAKEASAPAFIAWLQAQPALFLWLALTVYLSLSSHHHASPPSHQLSLLMIVICW